MIRNICDCHKYRLEKETSLSFFFFFFGFSFLFSPDFYTKFNLLIVKKYRIADNENLNWTNLK